MTSEMKVCLETCIFNHVVKNFGWDGGIGDPPDENTIRAIIRSTQEYLLLNK